MRPNVAKMRHKCSMLMFTGLNVSELSGLLPFIGLRPGSNAGILRQERRNDSRVRRLPALFTEEAHKS